MAIIYSKEIIKHANLPVHGESRVAQHEYWTAPLAVNPTVADTIQFGYLPPWARVTGACVSADRLDTNGAPTIAITVGDGGFTGLNGVVAADLARYFAATSVGRVANPAAANYNSAMVGYAQNFWNAQPAPLLILGTVTAIAATFAAGNFYLRMSYYIDEPPSALNQ